MTAPAVTIRIEGRPPSTNVAVRYGHWAQRATVAKTWRRTAYLSALAVRPTSWRPLTRATAHVEFIVPDKRRRDLDGLVSTAKNLWDGIVDASILTDDSTEVLVSVTYSVTVEPRQTATVFRVTGA